MSSRRIFLSVAAATMGAALSQHAAATPETESRFGTRAPRVCAEMRNAPSSAEAAALIQCRQEDIRTRDIVLLENLVVQIGAPQPYAYNAHSRLTGVDTTSQVYPIRGRFRRYSCDVVQVIAVLNSDNHGKNCSYVDKTAAEGFCWKTTFGSWECNMDDISHNDPVMEQPPPR